MGLQKTMFIFQRIYSNFQFELNDGRLKVVSIFPYIYVIET